MRVLWWSLLFSLLCSAYVPLQPTVVDQSLPSLTQFQLKWFDDFNTSGCLNTTHKWNIQYGFHDGGYTTNESVFIQNQNLYLRQSNESFGYSQGRVNSIPYFSFGFFEARIKFPNISGWHDSFWLVGLQTFPPPSNNVENDIIEGNSYSSSYASALHLHTWTNSTSSERLRNSITYTKLNIYTLRNLTEWNTFGLHWNRTHLEFYINGGRLLITTYPSHINLNPLNMMFTEYIWNDVRFPVINKTSYMIVDYAAYWKNPLDDDMCFLFPNINCI